MTLNHLFGKLKSQNKKEYRQFQFCIILAVLLITSYLTILFSPLVQNALPEGGDSRKQVYLIFGIAVLGCIVFSIYAASLFLRYKSKEIGTFIALGADKRHIGNALLAEVSKIIAVCSAAGILLGALLGLVVGKCFEWIASKANDHHFAFTSTGILSSLLFCLALYLCIIILSVRFTKRTNIMEIINEQRRQEPLKGMITKRYLWSGIVLTLLGMGIAIILPSISANIFRHFLGSWTNLFYLLTVIGLYRIMVYSIAAHKKGKKPQKYYDHIITYGMLKFQGASIVRNMLVIALLLIGGLFAAFYAPLQTMGTSSLYDSYEAGYSYFYPEAANELTKSDLDELGENYQVIIENYREAELIQVIGDGIEWDANEKGDLVEDHYDEFALYDCISTSGYETLTGKQLDIPEGQYLMVQKIDAYENVFHHFGDMHKLYSGDMQASLSLEYMGTEVCSSLVVENGFGTNSRFILNDQDYQALRAGLPEERFIRQVFFDTVENKNAILFSQELYQEYALRASEDMKVVALYDPCEEERVGKEYTYTEKAVFDPYNPIKEVNWQYQPIFVQLQSENFVMSLAVRFLLFIYVAVICLAATGIISYTRSKNITIRNQQVFADIEKLGANHAYLKSLLKEQIQKIYILPTTIGCLAIFAFMVLILWQNDGHFDLNDWKILVIILIFNLLIAGYQYVLYRLSMKEAVKTLGI